MNYNSDASEDSWIFGHRKFSYKPKNVKDLLQRANQTMFTICMCQIIVWFMSLIVRIIIIKTVKLLLHVKINFVHRNISWDTPSINCEIKI